MSQAYELRPSRRDLIWLNLGSVGLALVGVMVALVVRGTLWPGTTTVGVVEIVLVLVTTVTLAVMHEAIHGVAMIAVGIRRSVAMAAGKTATGRQSLRRPGRRSAYPSRTGSAVSPR
jgi:hypothetical protein